MNKPFPSNLRRGFSLIELLLVIAIISLLSALSVPAFSSISGASGTMLAANDISGLIEHARQTAMQTSTWVWVGIADTGAGADQQLQLVEVASCDGSPETSTGNLIQMVKPLSVKNVKILDTAGSDSLVLGSTPGAFSFSWNVGGKQVAFSTFVLAFSPRGEAVINSEAVPDWIRVNIVSPHNSKDTLSVLVSGPSGQVIVSR